MIVCTILKKSLMVIRVFHKNKNYLFAIQEYYKEFLIVGYNPLELEASVKVSCKENVTDKLIKELENLHNKCELRVQKALICEPGKWCSLGSEKEVDEEKSFFRKDKV